MSGHGTLTSKSLQSLPIFVFVAARGRGSYKLLEGTNVNGIVEVSYGSGQLRT